MGKEAAIDEPSFVRRRNGYYLHRCKKRGAIVLNREQMNVYRVEHGHIVNERAPIAHWEIDQPVGCPWCRDIPDDLIAIVEEVRIREELKRHAEAQKRAGKNNPAGTGE